MNMKKLISLLLAMVMVFGLTACGGNTEQPTEAATEAPTGPLSGTLEELLAQVIEIQPVEFMGGSMTLDLTDTSEDGLWMVKNYTGLDNADSIKEAAFYEAMMGSIPYSMVMVRVAEGADAATVAAAMKSGIDQRKWICVEADDLQVVSFNDVVMLIMVGSDTGLTSQAFVDAFAQVCANQYAGAQVSVH
jgi:hypothetical protein